MTKKENPYSPKYTHSLVHIGGRHGWLPRLQIEVFHLAGLGGALLRIVELFHVRRNSNIRFGYR